MKNDGNTTQERGTSTGPSQQDIATAAYYIAERRGFDGDKQVADWLEAEGSLEQQGNSDPARAELSGREHIEEDIKPDDINRWSEKLQVSAEQLRVAIQRVGPNSAKVREFLTSA